MFSVRDIDKGLRRIYRDVTDLAGKSVTVGFHEGAVEPNGKPTAEVAFINEYGTDIIPPRPFMSTTLAKSGRLLRKGFGGYWAVISGKKTPEQVLSEMGSALAQATKITIMEWKTPPNAASTVKKKGRDDPLQDSYTMRENVTFKIIDKGA